MDTFGNIIIFDPDESISFNVKYMLVNSYIKNVAIINTHMLCSGYEEIAHIVKNSSYLKMFFNCNEEEYKKIIANFSSAVDVFYLGKRLFIPEVVICYWKNKGFDQFSPTLVSSRNGLEIL